MGFLDDLFGKNSKPAAECAPDKPIPFGFMHCWLCVKADSPEEVIQKLGLKNPSACGWKDAMNRIKEPNCEEVFVTPVFDGYVLAINWGIDVVARNLRALDEAAAKFSELQYFSDIGVVDLFEWVKYVNGQMVRGYSWLSESGELILNSGEPTPEEVNLGYTNLIPDNDADWDDYELPGEEMPVEIAAAWGIDPRTVDKYPPCTGFWCEI
ncbi:MAG: hypothetical protein K2N06_12280 [Oscillospiraceae bacterium]|nr:hypothetical protein [Oscillospiraceae bacterium]